MAKIVSTRWVCDFCGDYVLDRRPDQWMSISIHPGPEHAEIAERRMLCRNCVAKVLSIPLSEQDEYREAAK